MPHTTLTKQWQSFQFCPCAAKKLRFLPNFAPQKRRSAQITKGFSRFPVLNESLCAHYLGIDFQRDKSWCSSWIGRVAKRKGQFNANNSVVGGWCQGSSTCATEPDKIQALPFCPDPGCPSRWNSDLNFLFQQHIPRVCCALQPRAASPPHIDQSFSSELRQRASERASAGATANYHGFHKAGIPAWKQESRLERWGNVCGIEPKNMWHRDKTNKVMEYKWGP